MEIRCPSCAAQHRSEDYPGAFDILCGCGYLILNPDLPDDVPNSYQEINFEGPPVGSEAAIVVDIPKKESPIKPDEDQNKDFSIQNLTGPEDLPSGMLYDPTEVPQNTGSFSMSEAPDASQVFVERVQKASMGQVLGPDYDLELTSLDQKSRLKAKERIKKFLHDHKWLREIMEQRSFILEDLFDGEKIRQIPEALAVEIYTACMENGGKCEFRRSE